jgi:hypothetical protein
MDAIEKPNWHGRLYALSSTMFDAMPPDRPLPCAYWTAVFGTMAYCVVGLAIFLTLNVCTLPLGVLAEPVWRRRAGFRLLRFPNRLPILPFSVAIILGYASYCMWMQHGLLMALGPWLFVGVLAAVCLGLSIACNQLRGVAGRSSTST